MNTGPSKRTILLRLFVPLGILAVLMGCIVKWPVQTIAWLLFLSFMYAGLWYINPMIMKVIGVSVIPTGENMDWSEGILQHKYVNASDDIAAYKADQCGRQAVSVEWAYRNLVDCTLYVFRTANHELGLEPWLTIDAGVDRNLIGNEYILCYGSVGEKIVPPNFRIFASKKDVMSAVGAD